VLWGRQHVAYGEIAVSARAPGVGIALTRGAHPKPYEWIDPNEDVVAAVVGERATLLAVADGHHGAVAAEVALTAVLESFGDDPPPALDDDGLVELFHGASSAVLVATRDLPDELRRESRTTLTVALLAGRRLCWAAVGDSPLFVVEGEHGMELTRSEQAFLGWPMARQRVDRLLQRGRGTLGRNAWVVLASDGFSNFSPPPPERTAAQVLTHAPDPVAGARDLVTEACAGGAGDNVAVAAAAPPGW
jgi:serine/threonine protein phosphatase PrpC